MTRLLVTGFDAFGGDAVNPSGLIVERLVARPPVAAFTGLVLPTAYDEAAATAIAAIDRLRPDLVVMFGLAARTPGLRLERFALNAITAEAADNRGVARPGSRLSAGGPPAHETRVDLAVLRDRLAATGQPVAISTDAGGFVCNALYYRVLDHLAARGQATPALFVHVPWVHAPVTRADFAEPPIDRHERIARLVIAALAPEDAGAIRTV